MRLRSGPRDGGRRCGVPSAAAGAGPNVAPTVYSLCVWRFRIARRRP